MNEATGIARKRTFVSPQKTQISITSFSRQKKQNNCATPERSALTRSFNSITTTGPKLNSPPVHNKLSNNPFQPLAEGDNEEEEMSNNTIETPAITETETETTSTSMIESVSTISSPIASPEKGISRKAIHALRKIRTARKVLMDSSLREELDKLLGEGMADHLTQELGGDLVESTGTTKIDKVDQEESVEETEKTDTPQGKNYKQTEEMVADNIERQESRQQHCQPTNTEKNVSFVDATSKRSTSFNSHSLRQGGNINNPYVKQTRVPKPQEESGVLYPQRPLQTPIRVDKTITLKKGNMRPYIHRYTLRFKTIAPKSEEEGHQIIIDTLQRFLATLIQAEPKTIIPPYLDLDRNDKSMQDISSAFPVSSIDSIHILKKYFFRLSNRNEAGMNWCSVILAQPIPFSIFIEKARYSLENGDFSLWPKASDNENATDVGWLLYSTRNQDEERLTSLLSKVTGENIGVKWKPIRASTFSSGKKGNQEPAETVRALHVECAVDRLQEVRDKLNLWYNSASNKFPDGTKMRLVPTINSVTSIANKTKFASCIARQAALNAGLASANTREISTNLLLDRKDPSTNKSFREVLMAITPEKKPGTTLFHTIDKQFKSDNIVNFEFHPENASEAHNLIAGLVPFLKDTGNMFHLRMFNPDALNRQAKAKWNAITREADSETDMELTNLLAEDDDLNFTNEPTLEKEINQATMENEPVVTMNIPEFPSEYMPSMVQESDSISTFHPKRVINLTEEKELDIEMEQTQPKPDMPASILKSPKNTDHDGMSRMSMSESASRISSLETELSSMQRKFQEAIDHLHVQAQDQAAAQGHHSILLEEILSMLRQNSISTKEISSTPPSHPSEAANHPQMSAAGDSSRVAGHG